ncbi:MAG TPA: sulfotransferase [Rhodanobacteraceae bacterium]|nr:sulfotransferase [Rhodanobacteraceae bacterium]
MPHDSTRDASYARQLQAAAQALERADAARAVESLAALRRAYPDDPEVLRLTAIWSDLRGRHDDALQAMRAALASRPRDALYYNTFATVLANAGHTDDAISALRAAGEIDPGLSTTWYNLGVLLYRAVRPDDAIAALQRALAIDPNHTAARTQLAMALRDGGRSHEAEHEYRAVLEREPASGAAWQGLSDLKTVALTRADVEAMRHVLRTPELSANDQVEIHFALAKALDDTGAYAESLAALAAGKRVLQRNAPWQRARFSAMVSHVLEVCTRPFGPAPARTQGREVVFIVGIPRSGTTLVEQILASHPDVNGSGELQDLRAVIDAASRELGKPFPGFAPGATPEDWERMGAEYLRRTRRWRQGAPMFTDKFTGNWLFVGAIMAMLPAARVVCCRRDPVETCFACYRQYRNQPDYTNTFDDLAGFWSDYDRAVKQWRRLYPDRVYEHSYEGLLQDTEASVARLLQFCGLPWAPACVRFFENARPVRSPSANQVREPLRPVFRAARYGRLLDPLRAALAAAANGTRSAPVDDERP